MSTVSQDVAYKGINSLVQGKDEDIFELQIHTSENLDTKERNIPYASERGWIVHRNSASGNWMSECLNKHREFRFGKR